jgi:Na+-translocating ferredoxin:NAD+ oxidoreductase subunit G
MAKLESTFKNMVLVLSVITLVSAVALGSVYNLTKEPIEASKRAKRENAIKEVLPQFERIDEAVEVNLEGMANPFVVYKAYQGDKLVGAAVQTYTMNGFSGEIKVMVGFNVAGEIVNYSILEQKETPGLGTKMDVWFKTEKGNQDIRGMHPAVNNLTVTKQGGEVDAITAATISSVAFLESVRSAYNAWLSVETPVTNASADASISDQIN